MIKVTKSIHIRAPVEKVFAYVADPVNRPQFWPDLIKVADVEPLPGGGHRLRWVYKMAGTRVCGTGQTIEHVPHRRTVDDNEGDVSGLIAWHCDPEGDGTRFTFDCEYHMHVPFLKRRSESFLIRLNEDQAERLVANVKTLIEAGGSDG